VLPEAAALIGQPPVRLRGTLGGTLAHADPAAEWCVLAVLLDAEVVARGQAGRRTIPASELFTGGHSTGLLDDEIIEEVRFPGPAATAVLQKFSAQRHGATIMVAAARVETDGSGRVRAAAIALGGVEDRPVRLPNAERSLVGLAPDATVLQDLTTAMAGQIRPTGPPGCRRDRAELAAVLAARAVRASLSRDVQTRAVASKDEDDSRIT
jgi:aerobic carbon-monoxide dehydrogenase medium subunit